MNPELQLILGTTIISLAVTYAWWVRIRVTRLRQDLFEIRDALFIQAAKWGEFDDPGYRATREYINGLASQANTITLPTLMYFIAVGKNDDQSASEGEPLFPHAASTRMERASQAALAEVSARLVDYLLRETLTGWAVMLCFHCFTFSAELYRGVRRHMDSILRLQLQETLDRVLKPQVQDMHPAH